MPNSKWNPTREDFLGVLEEMREKLSRAGKHMGLDQGAGLTDAIDEFEVNVCDPECLEQYQRQYRSREHFENAVKRCGRLRMPKPNPRTVALRADDAELHDQSQMNSALRSEIEGDLKQALTVCVDQLKKHQPASFDALKSDYEADCAGSTLKDWCDSEGKHYVSTRQALSRAYASLRTCVNLAGFELEDLPFVTRSTVIEVVQTILNSKNGA